MSLSLQGHSHILSTPSHLAFQCANGADVCGQPRVARQLCQDWIALLCLCQAPVLSQCNAPLEMLLCALIIAFCREGGGLKWHICCEQSGTYTCLYRIFSSFPRPTAAPKSFPCVRQGSDCGGSASWDGFMAADAHSQAHTCSTALMLMGS